MKTTNRRAFHYYALSLTTACFGGCAGFAVTTPSLFPNPMDVAIEDLPEALRQKLQDRYPDLKSLRIRYSAEESLYGVTEPSGSILLFDASGRNRGGII